MKIGKTFHLLFMMIILVVPTFSVFSKDQGDAVNGRKVFHTYCSYCHGEKGELDGINTPYLDPKPRAFTDVDHMSRLADKDLFDIISKGGPEINRSVVMPPWGKVISEKDIKDIIAYIRLIPKPGAKIPEIKGVELPKEKIAPDLSVAGSKLRREWVLEFLKNPKTVRPIGYVPLTESRMPNFRLTDEEAMALVDYLMSRKGKAEFQVEPQKAKIGEDLFNYTFGCNGCHQAKGEGGIVCPDLSQAPERLKPAWVSEWVRDPQSLDKHASMPGYEMTPEDARALASYIMSFNGKADKGRNIEEVGALAKKGEQLISDLGCVICHEIQGIDTTIKDEAPPLTHVGKKMKPGWLFSFLKNPFYVRPWLKGRMPNFRLTNKEALAITEYLMTLGNEELFKIDPQYRYSGKTSRVRLKEGEKYFTMYKCAQCHPTGKEQVLEVGEESLAPNFESAAQRLNADWLLPWLKDPQAIQPEANMPNFFYSEGEPLLEGNLEEQMAALRDYIMTLGEEKVFPEYLQAKARFPDVNPEQGKKLVADLNCIGCHTIENFPQEVRTNIAWR